MKNSSCAKGNNNLKKEDERAENQAGMATMQPVASLPANSTVTNVTVPIAQCQQPLLLNPGNTIVYSNGQQFAMVPVSAMQHPSSTFYQPQLETSQFFLGGRNGERIIFLFLCFLYGCCAFEYF